ncbi:MAG: carboxypeptidase-like regulatory domain-containing protein, partial [Ignavibacteriae bacterium]|nr:carboxypeptidase-like regulatory domain-containing protein [Ignavibacteriota bacterium]
CTKNVIDFTKLSQEEINAYFNNKGNNNICGRFKTEQLNTIYDPQYKRKSFFGYLSGIGIACIAFFNSSNLQAQEIKNQKETKNNNITTEDNSEQKLITARGVVSDDIGPIAGASVTLEGTNITTTTDFDGNFEFPQKLKAGDVLIFSYVGNTSKKVIMNKDSNTNIEIKIDLNTSDFIMVGKVAKKGVYSSKK